MEQNEQYFDVQQLNKELNNLMHQQEDSHDLNAPIQMDDFVLN